jgi:predicted amidohydrolase
MMRVLLAAVDAQKGDLDGNLARHLAVLDQARTRAATCSASPSAPARRSTSPRR